MPGGGLPPPGAPRPGVAHPGDGMADPFAKLYRRLRSDPAWQSLGDAACRVLVEYIMLSYPYDGQNRGVVCTPGDTASGLTTQPLSQAGRAKAVGRSRGALRRIESELEAAGCITLKATGAKRPMVVRLAGWCIDEQAEHDSQRVMLEQTDHDSPGVMTMTHSESCCAQNMTHDESCTRLTVSHVEADEHKGPMAFSDAREAVQRSTTHRERGGEGQQAAEPEPLQEPSDGNGTPPVNGSNGNDETIRQAVSFATGENMHTNESRQRVEDFVAEMRGAMTSGLTLEELLDALTALPPTGEHRWGRTWIPVAREYCIQQRKRMQQQLQSSIIAELLAAGSLEAQWQIATRLWDEHENLRPRLEPPPPGMPEAAAIWLPAAEWEPIARATGFYSVTEEQLRRAIAQRDGTETEEQRAQRERLRAMVDALRDGRPIPVSEPAQQAVEAGSRSRGA